MSTDLRIFTFGAGKADGDTTMKETLGGKGANLAEMSKIGLPVPPGFTLPTNICALTVQNGSVPSAVDALIEEGVAHIESVLGQSLGGSSDGAAADSAPLLLSVRSGAPASMPGMMDTVLNLGLNDAVAEALVAKTGNARFVYDAYRRFIAMFGDVVLEVRAETALSESPFEEILDDKKIEVGASMDVDLSADDMKDVVARYKALVEQRTGQPFPEDPRTQLRLAVEAVFKSWDNERAITYRKLNNIPSHWGTACNVQAMVFGNLGDDCGTGVAFTRDPSTGENVRYGEYLVNAQGEDVVAGIRTPQPILTAAKAHDGDVSLEEAMPAVFAELMNVFDVLERHYTDMQDIEFTIQNGRLWLLQTRTGKRTAKAAVRIAVEMQAEGLIDERTAVLRVAPDSLEQLLHPALSDAAKAAAVARGQLLATGLPASPGAATGAVVFSADDAEARTAAGEAVVLVRIETSPEDIHGMHASRGILTARGGMTSHAAVVARGMGKCCVAGAGDVRVDYKTRTFTAAGRTVKEGDVITLDGGTGQVFLGALDVEIPELGGELNTLMAWADKARRLRVRTNADTPADAQVARDFGAEGIGLCRTEHMFFEPDRIMAMREMILASDTPARERALAKLLPFQREDFEGIFKAMDGLPVTIRLLDPPLHEFLPHTEADMVALADAMGVNVQAVKAKAGQLHEFNPMLGHRGCRLAISYPEVARMQARAILEAAVNAKEAGVDVRVELMVPLISTRAELATLRAVIVDEADAVFAEKGDRVDYMVGTMIELPRAALTADDVAHEAEFFSFGTNDLTQTTFGLSRDDAGSFLGDYVDKGLLPRDPFVTLDRDGVGQLVKMGTEKGRQTRDGLKVGICGEHGGDPDSVAFCHEIGLDYVSCSPYRVPVARLAAAHAALG